MSALSMARGGVTTLLIGAGIGIALYLYEKWCEHRERSIPVYENIQKDYYDDTPKDYYDIHSSEKDSRQQLAIADEPSTNMKAEDFTIDMLSHMVDDLTTMKKDCQKKALTALNACKDKFDGKASFHWRMARSLLNCSFIEKLAGNQRKREELLKSAFLHAQKTVQIDEDHLLGQRYVALTYSEQYCHELMGNFKFQIAKHLLKKAHENNPVDPYISRELFYISNKERNCNPKLSQVMEDKPHAGEVKEWFLKLPSKKSWLYLAIHGFSCSTPSTAERCLYKGFCLESITPEDYAIHQEIIELARENRIILKDD